MFIKTLALSVFALAACATAQASTAVDNLSVTGNPGGVQPLSSTHLSIGEAFTTGTTALTLNDVVFPQLGGTSDVYNPSETFTLDLVTPITGTLVPQSAAFTLDNNTSLVFGNPGFAQTTAIPTSTMLLAPASTYMLVLSGGTSTVTWDYLPNDQAYASGFGVTLPTTNTTFVADGGASSYSSLSAGPQQFLVDVSAVPEPSTYCLLAVASLAFVVSRKRSVKVA